MSTSLDDFKLWYYTPSLPTAVIACIIFSVITIYHAWRLSVTKTWYCIPFVVGGLFEMIGYAARAAAHNNTERLMPYIIQSLLLLVAPPLFAASIYMILSRIIRAVGAESYSIIRINWVTRIFVIGDVTCFMIQSGGGGIMAAGNGANFSLGENIILGGLILQILVFMVFILVAGVFHSRVRRNPTPQSLNSGLPWERLMWILYSVSILITVRNTVRMVEYGMGSKGYLLTHEWPLYVFDGLLMAIVLGICTTWYQNTLRPRPKSLESYVMEQNYSAKSDRAGRA